MEPRSATPWRPAGQAVQGWARANGKYVAPAWKPPAEVRAETSELPEVIPGDTPKNPMGVAAVTLSGGEHAIHRTNRPYPIRTFASYGCIRMFNDTTSSARSIE